MTRMSAKKKSPYFRLFVIVSTFNFFVGCQSKETSKNSERVSYEEEILCVGSSTQANHAVYLHGFTGKRFKGQEFLNFQNLKKLSASLNMTIAVPKSSLGCWHKGKYQRCWGTDMTRAQAIDTVAVAKRAARKCFPKNSNYGLIGFSNGGYVATKIFGYCLAPRQALRLKWIVTVGAAKLWGSGFTKTNLRSCLPIDLVAGKRDRHNYERRQNKFRDLRRKGAQISILLFDGGHELPYGPMVTVLRKYMN